MTKSSSRGDSAMCCGLGVETLAETKNACDTVVAAFFDVHNARYRDAFHPQARSHRTITALCDGIGEGATSELIDAQLVRAAG